MTETRETNEMPAAEKAAARPRYGTRLALVLLLLAAAVTAYRHRDLALPLYLRLRGCPESLIALAGRNPETKDFVLGYFRHTDLSAAAPLTGEVRKGETPLLLQWDERWGYTRYGSDYLAVTGCGPTCLAMACCAVTGRADVTPYTAARLAEENGWYVPGVGTAWALMTEEAEKLGFCGEAIGSDEASLSGALRRGSVLICSMRPGDFTAEGHFIVLCGIDSDGYVTVRDPNSPLRSAQLWDVGILAAQTAGAWEYAIG